jgi:hypothetical protein
MRRTKHLTLTIAALALGLLLPLAARAQGPCAEVFEQLYPEGTPKQRGVKGEPQNTITYGLEAEFDLTKAPGVLDWYRKTNKTDDQWFAMSLDERKAAIGTDKYSWNGMVKTSRAPDWLKDTLSSDPGGAELITKVAGSLEEALDWVRQVEVKGGGDGGPRSKVFYWQGNVAYRNTGAFTRENRDGLDGYVRVMGDVAQFGKLHTGYETHLQNAEFIPGKNLGHGVLGPLNTSKMADITNELTAAAEGRNISGNGHYIQGTFYRTWPYGPNGVGMEVRDAHKDVFVLRREMRRITHGLENGFAAYAPFKTLTILDETAHFNLFSEPVQSMLRTVGGYSQYGRYAIPMRPLENEYPGLLGLQGAEAETFKSKITNARGEYVRTLESLAADTSMDNATKLNKVRIAIAKFTYDTGIYTALDSRLATFARGATPTAPRATPTAQAQPPGGTATTTTTTEPPVNAGRRSFGDRIGDFFHLGRRR